jgi:hypothetical protein
VFNACAMLIARCTGREPASGSWSCPLPSVDTAALLGGSVYEGGARPAVCCNVRYAIPRRFDRLGSDEAVRSIYERNTAFMRD